MTMQVSWRADEELVERAKRRARSLNTSLNSYLTFVVDAATNPDVATTEGQRLRERLEAAGLLAHTPPPQGPRPSAEQLEQAATEAGRGIPLSEYVATGRGE